MSDEHITGLKVLPFEEAARRMNRSRSKLYEETRFGSATFNPKIPRPVHDVRVGFYEHEVDAYLLELKRVRDATDPYLRSLANQEGGASGR